MLQSVERDLQYLTRMLGDVLQLTEKVIADKTHWHSTTEEASFLAEVSMLSGQTLPQEASRSADVDLGFLLMATFALQATLQLRETLERAAHATH